MMRSLRHDSSVTKEHLTPGTVRRIARYAKPFSRNIAAFLALVVVDSVIVIANPLLMKAIIDDGIIPRREGVVIALALVIAGLAVADAVLTLAQRWFSARIGEGLIYDLRTEVFDHVQRMPVAFFTRTQTGALVSRLNNDVIGAQQAFTSTLSGGGRPTWSCWCWCSAPCSCSPGRSPSSPWSCCRSSCCRRSGRPQAAAG